MTRDELRHAKSALLIAVSVCLTACGDPGFTEQHCIPLSGVQQCKDPQALTSGELGVDPESYELLDVTAPTRKVVHEAWCTYMVSYEECSTTIEKDGGVTQRCPGCYYVANNEGGSTKVCPEIGPIRTASMRLTIPAGESCPEPGDAVDRFPNNGDKVLSVDSPGTLETNTYTNCCYGVTKRYIGGFN